LAVDSKRRVIGLELEEINPSHSFFCLENYYFLINLVNESRESFGREILDHYNLKEEVMKLNMTFIPKFLNMLSIY
jgi:hypothetical protein